MIHLGQTRIAGYDVLRSEKRKDGLSSVGSYIEVNGIPGYQAGADILVSGQDTQENSKMIVVGYQDADNTLDSSSTGHSEHSERLHKLKKQKQFAS
jgi:hypothetical protein